MTRMRHLIRLFVFVFAGLQIAQAQTTTSCAAGEVGVVVSLSFTQVMPVGEVTWDIQDAPFTFRIVNSNERELIGGKEMYQAFTDIFFD